MSHAIQEVLGRVLRRHIAELEQLVQATRDHREVCRLNRLRRHAALLLRKLCEMKKG